MDHLSVYLASSVYNFHLGKEEERIRQEQSNRVDDDEWMIEEDSEIALQLHKWLRYVSSSPFCLFFFPFIRNDVLSS